MLWWYSIIIQGGVIVLYPNNRHKRLAKVNGHVARSLLSLRQKGALENTLAETEARYSAMLAGYQNTIHMLEGELSNVRASIEQQGQDYRLLLDVKTRLEQEIATYRSLLETEESR